MFVTPLLDIDTVFDAVFARPNHRPMAGAQALHVEETDEAYILRASLPGIRSDEVNIDVTSKGVTLMASRSNATPDGFHPVRLERTAFTVDRTFRAPVPLDADAAEATMANGILTLTLPKAAEVAPRKLTVKAA